MSERPPLRVLIVDDEPLARQRLADLLRKEAEVEIVGQADNGDTAVSLIATLQPQLVFLDMQMPGKTGIEVVRAIGAEHMPPVIFVTAYDRYALNAFDVGGIDYLLKPFDDERFEQAFRRARRRIDLEEIDSLAERLRTVLTDVGRSPDLPMPATPTQFLERIPVEMPGQVRVVPVSDIDYISASGPYAELHVGDKTYVVRERMQALEEQLDPAAFMRVHRSSIVCLTRIETLLRDSGGDYAVRLKSGVRLDVSRSRVAELERWMGVAS